jgi:valyl-tRNA synthetase
MFELDGKANQLAGKFKGVDRLALRQQTLDELQQLGYLRYSYKERERERERENNVLDVVFRGEKDHSTSVAICSRSGDVIEPLPMPQW